ncbi:cell division protein FtsN [Lonepinella sp. MS14436]|uniref:cell division protein FtsN n=1 Tax=Lonepinella sp. MS14436 TaxID=3003619 RepID=UPI0036DE0866
MAQRDYAVHNGSKKKKSGRNKSLLLAIAAGVVVAFVIGLYLLKEKAPESVTQNPSPVVSEEKDKHKSQLPSRLEETFSYIKELESRSITNNQQAQLSESQKAELKRLQEEEQARQAALDKLKQAEDAKVVPAEPAEQANTAKVVEATDATSAVSDESKLKAEQERRIMEQKKAEQAKIANAKKEESKKANIAKSTGKFGLQCGAFNDRAKAESLQARLAMSGLNARITESGKWNRVLVGPIGDRPAAVSAQQQASAVAGCVVIGM